MSFTKGPTVIEFTPTLHLHVYGAGIAYAIHETLPCGLYRSVFLQGDDAEVFVAGMENCPDDDGAVEDFLLECLENYAAEVTPV